ncbi:MAG: glucose-phosphate thymidylyltransferase [Fibrobacteria bacterium]|jgi:glucose-1-phosphate thymidylyltransferase|nr:glucose-phosphate thymidylyltransferase [Fibrobacteria bacterium]
MKGIILAGGAGSRLYPLSKVASKQLQPIYDKPMIYYPLSTLMLGGIRDILLISTPDDVPRFQHLLGDGSQWGLKISYTVQAKPDGLAQAFVLGEEFLAGEPATLILGDNVFYGKMKLDEIIASFTTGARVFGYPVGDPERYGVVEFDAAGKVVGLEEKPAKPKSHYAVPGLYIYDGTVCAKARALKPSPRGEYEITDLNNVYLREGGLSVSLLGRGIAWLDTGTHASLLEASHFIYTLEARQGLKIACLEEIAYLRGFIDKDQMRKTMSALPKSPYREYLEKLFPEVA